MAVSNFSKLHSQAHRISTKTLLARRSTIAWASKIKQKISELKHNIELLKRGFFSRIKHYSAIVIAEGKVKQLASQLTCWLKLTSEEGAAV